MTTLVGLGLAVVLLLVPGRPLAADFKLKLPLGLQEDAAQVPDDNPITAEKVGLGKKFFWDERWSASGTVSCAGCHRPDHGWSDSRTFSVDFAGQPTAQEQADLVEFMKALSGEIDPEVSRLPVLPQ